jgi:hypothetical protein
MGGIDIEWIQHVLLQLQNLKRLKWIIPGDRFFRGADGVQAIRPFLRGLLENSGREAEVSVQSVQRYDDIAWYRLDLTWTMMWTGDVDW